MNLNSRLSKLEAKARPAARRIVVKYADKMDPAELKALRSDPDVTLMVVEYVDRQPITTITDGAYKKRVGVDIGLI